MHEKEYVLVIVRIAALAPLLVALAGLISAIINLVKVIEAMGNV